LPEVAGQAAVLVDPYDIKDIANGLTVVIDDQALRQELVKKGLARAKKFSWDKVAYETYQVYQQVVQGK